MPRQYVITKFAPTEEFPYGEHGVLDVNVAFENPRHAKVVGNLLNKSVTVRYKEKLYPGATLVELGKSYEICI